MTAPTPLEEDTSFLLARASALAVHAANEALAPHDLRVRPYAVLALSAGAEPPTQRELADHLRLDPSQIVALVDELESRGLVRRSPHPSDRRTRVVGITEAGTELLSRAEPDVRDAEKRRTAGLSAEQRRQLTSLLRVIAFSVSSD
ncbi:MarR family transcriptional regulator [Microcella alkalica]|uniref:DNA-binding MarR family transcriptional regulator n=1 Tax=Microcella alkalica TaxID=355930 RepID=A0A839EB68_9MICO|nr:MarR family transcriptional regulator [Microcella alkalica]MBA8848707.1 DNA-binding MarR family transcriptional regulator [Microcella alkalica]